ncbi:glycosyltransferase [Tropicimonas sp. TH_r6]|uniref:glycosyltransferase family 2 protein n=1 Tax=Tropicimonas sp. TH_r6 TaxID=3082085 RepID=UPI002955393D|nr:glycosyltransferase [Tropicimonas sp. TH_r6]MDV7141402.1 glycosyltransferase [Tropicimonas sp. TH_r6]
MRKILQNVVLPEYGEQASAELYYRKNDISPPRYNDSGLALRFGQQADFCTFYNVFSCKKWRSFAPISGAAFRLYGTGTVRCQIFGHTEHALKIMLRDLELDLGSEVEIPLEDDEISSLAAISFRIVGCREESTLLGGAWSVEGAPKREVKLDIVITTFNREDSIQKTIEAFRNVVLPGVPDRQVHLTVVDNGETITPSVEPGIEILHNRNLGGAGGFTRGLMESLKSDRNATHVLFMDDDAACQRESILRTLAVLEYAEDDRTAVAGAMLIMSNPTVQFEKSARFYHDMSREKRTIKPIGSEIDLSYPENVIRNDLGEDGNYGAWWYFAFPVSQVKHLPFPFFVRGDDIDFSLSNDFNVVTLNGVASHCDDFSTKKNPISEYLAQRSNMALAFMHGEDDRIRRQLTRLYRRIVGFGNVFDFGMMRAAIWALEDAIAGPEAFAHLPSPKERLQQLKRLSRGGELSKSDLQSLVPVPPKKGSLVSRLFQRPQTNFSAVKDETKIGVIKTANNSHRFDTWAFQRVVLNYEDVPCVFERDQATYIELETVVNELIRTARKNRAEIRSAYLHRSGDFRTETYWQSVLGLETGD